MFAGTRDDALKAAQFNKIVQYRGKNNLGLLGKPDDQRALYAY